MRRKVTLLGASGSIGRQALDVIRTNSDKLELYGVCARRPVSQWGELVEDLRPSKIVSEFADGASAVERLAADDNADIVLNAIVGAAGLKASLAVLRSGRTLALANKESVVAAGALVCAYRDSYGGSVIPVDSEHSAIFQCLLGERHSEIQRLILTASGGPFRGISQKGLSAVSPEQAIRHPRWKMGPKISVDSATLMNKGLEVIEAHFLFDIDYNRIDVALHPQSIAHSLVEFADGSIKAHMGPTDMRVPIQYALSYPERWEVPCGRLDLSALASLEFAPLENGVYPAFELAMEAGRLGRSHPAVLSAANEVAVEAFIGGKITFTVISDVIRRVLERHKGFEIEEVADFERADDWARQEAMKIIGECGIADCGLRN